MRIQLRSLAVLVLLVAVTNGQQDVELTDGEGVADIPPRWEAAVRKLISSIMANPPEELFEVALDEIRFFQPHINRFLSDFDEDKKAAMVEDLQVALTKAVLTRSRIPLKHRLTNAAIGVIVDYKGTVPSKKDVTPEMAEHAKKFSETLLEYCRADKKCKRYAPK